MCELLAISSRHPTTVSMSLDRFARNGSPDSDNRDGWGIAYYAEGDIRRFRDVGPAATSAWVKFVEQQEIHCTLFLAHIRHANVGVINLPNTHPFARELGGNMHTFAHNGFLENFEASGMFQQSRFQCLGSTDSEWAFCGLMEGLADTWLSEPDVPDINRRLEVIDRFASRIRALGISNFVYSDGDALFAHADRRIQADGTVREPGLWIHQQRARDDIESVSGGGIQVESPPQRIVMVASVPLTDDDWVPMSTGELVALRDGEIYS